MCGVKAITDKVWHFFFSRNSKILVGKIISKLYMEVRKVRSVCVNVMLTLLSPTLNSLNHPKALINLMCV